MNKEQLPLSLTIVCIHSPFQAEVRSWLRHSRPTRLWPLWTWGATRSETTDVRRWLKQEWTIQLWLIWPCEVVWFRTRYLKCCVNTSNNKINCNISNGRNLEAWSQRWDSIFPCRLALASILERWYSVMRRILWNTVRLQKIWWFIMDRLIFYGSKWVDRSTHLFSPIK